MAPTRWPRVLLWIGLAALIVGAVDPLEGSIVILIGALLLAWAAQRAHLRARRQLLWSASLITLGVALLWGVSALGGFGGDTGRSMWWALVLLPYPVGWILGLVGTVRSLRTTT